MKFLIVSDAPILWKGASWQAYAPYVKEMNLWMSAVTKTNFICPTKYHQELLTIPFVNQNLKIKSLRRLEFHTKISGVISFLSMPYQIFILWHEMRKTDHIHLRCPGNLALLACFVQIFFPWKKKTAKYAGNWDPRAKQPLSYRIQKWLLSNRLLTRNMQVLVYGDWNNNNKNIKPFFTASYWEQDKIDPIVRSYSQPLKALFVGTMGENKRPYETVQLIEELNDMGVSIRLDMYGEGSEMPRIEIYILKNNLEHLIKIHGNQPSDVIKGAYLKSDILILLSKSEGWPKAVAEAMFFGVIPIATSVSAVPWMLGEGSRGFLINNVNYIRKTWLGEKLTNEIELKKMSNNAQQWSRQYTLESFERAIKKILE